MAAIALPRQPHITSRGVPEAENNAVWHLVGALTHLRKYTDDFEAAVSLFEFALSQMRQNPQIERWARLAARDGAMSLFHFAQTIKIVRGSLNEAPTILALVDSNQLRTADRLLRSNFPGVEAMRHSIAHAGEIASNTKNFDRHAFSGSAQMDSAKIENSEGVMISDALIGRKYTNTFEGSFVSYEISIQSLEYLVRALSTFYSGFYPAEDSVRLTTRPRQPT